MEKESRRSKTPIGVFLCGGFTVGIICGFFTHFFIIFALVWGLAGVFFYKSIIENRASAAIFLLALVSGFFYFHSFLRYQQIKIAPLAHQSIIEGRVVSEPIQKNKNRSFVIETQSGASMMVIESTNDEISYGDTIILKEGKRAKSPSFPALIISYPKIEEVRHEKTGMITTLIAYKNTIFSVIRKLLPSQESALAIGLLFGDTSGFTNAMKEIFQKSGTTHIVALSGYNITIIANVLLAVLIGVIGRRAVKIITISVVAIFVMIAGGAPSAVRAAAMVTALILATELGRKTTPLVVMLYAGAGMLVYDPTIAFYSVGFQLSFVSLLGIILTSKGLSDIAVKMIPLLKKHEIICETIAVSTAAYIATMPIIVWYFGSFSFAAILVNTVVVPTVPLAMLAVAVLSITGLLSVSGAWPVALITFLILKAQIFFITQSTRLPLFFTIESTGVMIGVIGASCGAVLFLHHYQKKNYG